MIVAATGVSVFERRNFFGALWHGAFLALGTALTQPTTVIAAFIADLTNSTVWVGGLSTVLTVAQALPQLFVARLVEPRPRKMPYLLLAIYLRVASWGALAVLTYALGASRPRLLAWVLVGLLAVFYAGGGLGGVPYTDIAGATLNGRQVGFASALLELSPTTERPTYSALNGVLLLPLAFLPLVSGTLLQYWPYPALFIAAAVFIGTGALLTRRLNTGERRE